jgi:hypothetical protein
MATSSFDTRALSLSIVIPKVQLRLRASWWHEGYYR